MENPKPAVIKSPRMFLRWLTSLVGALSSVQRRVAKLEIDNLDKRISAIETELADTTEDEADTTEDEAKGEPVDLVEK